jgi:MoxR-like ATPase
VLRASDVLQLQEAVDHVHLSPELAEYIVEIARETRRSPHLALGVSPRGQLAWRNGARAAALADGRDYVLPDDLKSLALPVLAHRVVAASPAEALGPSRRDVERVLTEILERIPAPG